jgi:hypothetical protein
MAGVTRPRNLNPARRHRSYPRAQHNSYKVKRPGDIGAGHVMTKDPGEVIRAGQALK